MHRHQLLRDRRVRVLAVFAPFAFVVWLASNWLSAPAHPVALAAVPSASLEELPKAMLIVDVVGAVRSPGVVELPAGSRVFDAVAAAGGLKRGAAAGVNLARTVVDGEQIVVGAAAGKRADGLLNLNTATESDFEELPGVGPVLAARIVEYRAAHGPFSSVNSLDAVSGVGPAVLAQLRPLVTIG